MFDGCNYESILNDVLENAPAGIDTRQGSIFYDAVAAVCFKIANYYADLSAVFDMVFLTTAVDEYLDEKGNEYGVYRNSATQALYEFTFTGQTPGVGERFFADSKYFTLITIDNELYLEAEEAGQTSNYISLGATAIPVNTIDGLVSSTFSGLYEPGADIEDDDGYRQRIREKLSGPAENGNRQHYKTWCEEISGVGRARIIPLWNGENTVKGVIVGTDGTPAAQTVIDRVQEYIDPGALGLGNGVANIGAHFTVVSATAVYITVSLNAVLSAQTSLEQAILKSVETVTAYFKELALDTPDYENITIRLSAIGTLLYLLPEITDYSDLKLNGDTANIDVTSTQVAVLKEVIINAVV